MHIKDCAHHIHLWEHQLSIAAGRFVHNRNFWLIAAILTAVVVLMLFLWWAAHTGGGAEQFPAYPIDPLRPGFPGSPYGY